MTVIKVPVRLIRATMMGVVSRRVFVGVGEGWEAGGTWFAMNDAPELVYLSLICGLYTREGFP
jgi:hypothetical protein